MTDPYPNIALIVLDSLRYDVAQQARTPNLDKVLQEANAGHWRRCFSRGDYTLPSTISMLHAGFLPDDRHSQEPIYNRQICGAMRCQTHLHGPEGVLYALPQAENVVKGWEALGYNTVGIGGVGWFNSTIPTAQIWERYFQRWRWCPDFHENNPQSLGAQLAYLGGYPPKEPYFLFLNVASTHSPYLQDASAFERTPERQTFALEQVERQLPRLLSLLPRQERGVHIFLCADHGDCFGEDGLWGHGFYHPKVLEVPFVHFLLERG